MGWSDKMEIINEFEELIAKHCGSRFGVAVDSGTNAIFLSLLYLKSIGDLHDGDEIVVPCRTYQSVPMAVMNAGLRVRFKDVHWCYSYCLSPSRVYDSAVRFEKDMYISGSFFCLSFQYRKALPIGRGGMVLTDDEKAMGWLRQARHNGKHMGVKNEEDTFEMIGYDMYLTPEQAARGISLFFASLVDKKCFRDYPDLSKQKVFQ